MYTIQFPPEHEWTITASSDLAGWLDDFASLMTLRACTARNGRRISITATTKEASAGKGNGWNGFGGRYGQFAWKCETGEIHGAIPEDALENWTIRAWTFKSLLIAIGSMLPVGTIFLHAATCVKDGEAVLVAASSGGGKSTLSRRLPAPWTAPGDEWSILVPDGAGGYNAQVLPTWSMLGLDGAGRPKWNTQLPYPVRAICILKQDTVDTLERLGSSGAAVCLSDASRQVMRHTLLSMDDAFRTWFSMRSFEAACAMAARVPVYLLRASLNGKIGDVLGKTLRKG